MIYVAAFLSGVFVGWWFKSNVIQTLAEQKLFEEIKLANATHKYFAQLAKELEDKNK